MILLWIALPLILVGSLLLFWPLPYTFNYQQHNWQICCKLQLMLFQRYRWTLGQKKWPNQEAKKPAEKTFKKDWSEMRPRAWLAEKLKTRPEKIKTLAWHWKIILGTGDPALTGWLCGFLGALQEGFLVKMGEKEGGRGQKPQGLIEADFQNKRLEVFSDYVVKLSLWQLWRLAR